MSNYTQAMGQTSGGAWCSSANPQANCTITPGVCKPMTSWVLALFKELQNQLNRLAVAKGYSKINVDGRIGSKTVELYNKAVGGSFSGCDALSAMTVDGRSIALAKTAAAAVGAPASVPPPITSRPSIAKADGSVVDPPAMAITDTLFGLFENPLGLLVLAGGGYVAYRSFGKKKGRKTRKRTTRRRTTRRRRTARR